MNNEKYLINIECSIKNAMIRLNSFSLNDGLTLFVTDDHGQLCGALTDGDIRRGLLNNAELEDPVDKIMNKNFKFLNKPYSQNILAEFRQNGIELLPLLNADKKIDKIINLQTTLALLPLDVVVMAGGRGERLRPLTKDIPKPMLYVGDKPIIEHAIDRLCSYGINNIFISVNYLSNIIIDYFGDGKKKDISISYIHETNPLGTIGSVSLIEKFNHDHILVMNSDILTTIDWENFYSEFILSNADMMIATIPYEVQIPYAVLETNQQNQIISFKEKPSYTYHSNAGIYLIKKEFLDLIPKNSLYNATDLIEKLISLKLKVISYEIREYWLDIGRHDDFKKANEDINHLKL